MILDERAYRGEADAHRLQHAQQRGFHHGAPVRHPASDAHAYDGLHQSETHQGTTPALCRVFGDGGLDTLLIVKRIRPTAAELTLDAKPRDFRRGQQWKGGRILDDGFFGYGLNGKAALWDVRKRQDEPNRTHRLTAFAMHQQSMDRMGVKIVFLKPVGVLS